MNDSFDTLLLRRALATTRRNTSVKTFYGHHAWAKDLDIVNELGGHTGCVNALSWSTSGGLLASGSDDTYLNIWDYNPSNMAKPFTLNTSVDTGHSANIFSVKFMPHSSDRTVITCAGDSQVRVFDLEYGGANTNMSDTGFTTSTRSRRFNDFFSGVRWLNEGNTNARVYRSHADRAKRIVTESSPHLFLTCSEDGEVRQWDLRQPSSAYPAARRSIGYARLAGRDGPGSDDLPPPLISYKKWRLDLNSISCAASQPQYIALGGAHLHCFLHDRRMLGRDLMSESGQPGSAKVVVGTNEDESMAEATRCVKRFAPNDKRKMGARDHGHITACKISDANPNDMVVSWSADHIYSFDIIKSPDAREKDEKSDQAYQAHRLKHQNERKRKRAKKTTSSSSLADSANPSQRLRRVSDGQTEEGHTALRVRYGNGETDEIPIESHEEDTGATAQAAHDTLLTEAQKLSERIARSLVRLRKTLFDFSTSMREDMALRMETSPDLTPYTTAFTTVLGQCASLLPEMDDVIRTWSYPVNPSAEDVALQNTLRANRQAAWRFVQASGSLSKILGGKLQTLRTAPDPRLALFENVRPAALEGKRINSRSRFFYDFLKAILCWIEGGQQRVIQAFIRPVTVTSDSLRFPLDVNDDDTTSIAKLCDYLLDLADDERPIIDLDANRFEYDDNRFVFQSQKAAVNAFSRALSGIVLQNRQGVSELRMDLSTQNIEKRVMDRGAAARFWALKVGRSLLMEAAEGVTFDFVNRAFGGLRLHLLPEFEESERSQEDIDPNEEERVVEAIDLITNGQVSEAGLEDLMEVNSSTESTNNRASDESQQQGSSLTSPPTIQIEDVAEDQEVIMGEIGEEDEDDEDDNDDDYSEDESAESDGDPEIHPLFRRRARLSSVRERASVNLHVPYSSHTKVYKGHCNTRTVKDVNYYGLNDEYIVSGSDDGHFFIWDRKTTQIINILEGDGEVVNVVQGHPYEPMIACSGIDSTIKVFGPGGDSKERVAASRGINVANPGGSVHSSLMMGGRRRRRGGREDNEDEEEEEEEEEENEEQEQDQSEERSDNEDEDKPRKQASQRRSGLKSRKAIHRQYEITSQNDVERRRGMGEAYVTEGMLARLAAALQRGQIQAVMGQGFGGTGGTVVVDDNCLVM